MPLMRNLNGKLVEMTPEEEAEHIASLPPPEEVIGRTRAAVVADLRAAAARRILASLIDADPDYQAAVAEIEKAGTADEIRAAFAVATKQESPR